MSDNRLAEIRARLEAATPGKWIVRYRVNIKDAGAFWRISTGGLSECFATSQDNAAFIAAAPDDIRYLLAEVERLEAENDALRERQNEADLDDIFPGILGAMGVDDD